MRRCFRQARRLPWSLVTGGDIDVQLDGLLAMQHAPPEPVAAKIFALLKHKVCSRTAIKNALALLFTSLPTHLAQWCSNSKLIKVAGHGISPVSPVKGPSFNQFGDQDSLTRYISYLVSWT